MSKIPVFIQQDSMDCGIACIAMVCKWYGLNYSIPFLKERCVPTKEGVSMKGIATTLESIGFNVIGGRITVETLINKVSLPVIIHWEHNHFVTVFKIDKNKKTYNFTVSDPAVGVIKYSQKEFEEKWITTRSYGEDKGIALLIDGGCVNSSGDTANKQSGNSSLKILIPFISKYKKYFLQLIFGYLIISMTQLIFPQLTKSIVDIGIESNNLNFIFLILVAQLTLLLSSTLVKTINNWLTLQISSRVNISLVSGFLIKLMKLPVAFFDSKKTGDIVQRIIDHNRIEAFITTQSLSLLYSIISMIVFSIVLFSYNLLIFNVFFAFSIVYFIWLLIFMKKRKVLDYKVFGIATKNSNVTYQLINGMQETKLQGCTQSQRWIWEDVRADRFSIDLEALKLSQTQSVGATFINELKNVIIIFLSASLVIDGEITLGMMLAIQYIIGQLTMPISQIANYLYDIQDMKISLERINEIKDKEDENKNRNKVIDANDKSINISKLYFSYEGSSNNVLRDINLQINDNETIAIVGSSGSGKTTLLKLILQYYKPNKGNISISGKDLSEVNCQSLWENCSVVMQDGYLFSDTIARNIAISDTEIDLERLHYASKMSMLSDYIESLPLKYNTKVGEDGRSLSSGQKQRLLIARAIYKNANFLFFDEATNSLDATNEKYILNNINYFIGNKTAIIIAHRLSTVKNADRIVVLENGEIAEIGTHSELIANKSYYYNLILNQLELDENK